MRKITQLAALFLCLLARKLPRNPTFWVIESKWVSLSLSLPQHIVWPGLGA